MTLGRRPHTWPEGVDPPVPYPVTCQVCDYTLGPNVEPRDLCRGRPENRSELKRSGPPKRKTPLREVSEDRTRKRSSSVTDELLVNTEVCGWVVRQERCYLAAALYGHTCQGAPGRALYEPAHIERRGQGYGDWIVREGRIVLNVVGACPQAHDLLDGQVTEEPDRRQFYQEAAKDEAARLTAECPLDPPEHYRLKARGELL